MQDFFVSIIVKEGLPLDFVLEFCYSSPFDSDKCIFYIKTLEQELCCIIDFCSPF